MAGVRNIGVTSKNPMGPLRVEPGHAAAVAA